MTSKFLITKKTLSQPKQSTSNYLNIIRQFNGSITKLIADLIDSPVKTRNIQHNKITSQDQIGQYLAELSLQRNLVLQQRVIQLFSIINNQKKIWLYGRSLWDYKQFSQIIEGKQDQPIGLTLIDKKIELTKQFQWFGQANIVVEGHKINNLQARSYLASRNPKNELESHEKIKLFQLQEYFTQDFIDLIKKHKLF